MANDLLVRILGDTKGLERSFARANTVTTQFGRNVETTGKKADRAARSFSSFGKGAFAGFAGAAVFTSVSAGIQKVISAAAESENVLGQTRLAVENTGQAWTDYGKRIEQAIQAQSRLGFDDEALLRTFSLFVRQSKDVGEALRRNNIAMDLARARFIDLESAALLVNKAALGQAGALRRVGIDARTGASGVELLAQLEREFGGAAEEASNTAQASMDRYKVAVENAQESIGRLLLPKLTEMAEGFVGTVEAVEQLSANLKDLKNLVIPPIEIPIVTRFLGGAGGGRGGSQVKSAAKTLLTGSIFSITDLLNDAIRGQGIFAPKQPPNENALAKEFEKNYTPFLKGVEKGAESGVKAAAQTAERVKSFGEKGFQPLTKSLKQVREEREKAQAEIDALAQERRDTAAAKLLAGLSLGIDRAELTSGLRDDVVALEAMKRGLQALISRGQDVQENQARLVQTIGAIAAKRAEIAERAKAALQAKQFRLIGLTAEGGEVIPGIDNLRKQFDSLSKRLVGSDVPRKLQDRMRLVGKFLAKGAKDATEETRTAIRDLFREIRGTFDQERDNITGPLTKTTSLNANKILDGLGLGRDAEKELRARLSSFNSAGKALAGGGNRPTGSFFVPGGQPVEIHTTVTLDGEVVGRNVRKSNQKNARRNPVQKRGPNRFD
ncbi:MAG TPA: hypothetical protein VJW75_00760 [Candidatus Eisenbacteria bacterium]|nr:hypothetical protein [Candidatus Eisenbacteria bacterium]